MDNPAVSQTPTEGGPITSRPDSPWTGFLWVLFGFGMSASGAFIAGILTMLQLVDSYDEFAGLFYLFTVPAGWIAGFLVATVAAWLIDRGTSRSGSSRVLLASIGSVVPVVLLVLAGLLAL